MVLDWNGYTKSQSYATQQAWFYTDGIHMRPAGATALAEYLKANLDASGLAACTPGEAQAGVPDPTTGDPATPPAALTGFTGIEPTRDLDTRFVEYGGGDGMLGAGRTVGWISPPTCRRMPRQRSSTSPPSPRAPWLHHGVRLRHDPTPPTSTTPPGAPRRAGHHPHTDGTICVYSPTTHLIVDRGCVRASSALFHPCSPRWVDLRGNPAVVTIGGRSPPDRRSTFPWPVWWGGRRRHRRG